MSGWWKERRRTRVIKRKEWKGRKGRRERGELQCEGRPKEKRRWKEGGTA